MHRILYFIVAVFISNTVLGQSKVSTSSELIENLKNGAAVVRLYMNKPKVDMLQKSINDERTGANEKMALQKMLNEHQEDRAAYVQRTIKAFNDNYNFSKVYFMYDYDQKKLKEGVKLGIFLNESGNLDPSIVLNEEHLLIFGRGSNDDSVVISQLNGEEMPKEFPTTYKRSVIHLFSFVFSKDKLGNFVGKLNQKLKKFYFKKTMGE